MEENKEIVNTHVLKDSEQTGRIAILDDAFNVIAAIAASEVDGVNPQTGSVSPKAVKTEVSDGSVQIYLSFNVSFDGSIPAITSEVQEKIKNAVESMTEFTVECVNIKISGVEARKEN